MRLVRTVQALRQALSPYRKKGKSIGLVPTMGALHEGHLSLIKKSVAQCDVTVVSVFVNPIQFSVGEDLEKYPRRLKADMALSASVGAEIIFAPSPEVLYSTDHQTYVSNDTLQDLYCGAYRPGHFRGVLTVVAKLFLLAQPDFAYFGKKDYQQVALIQRMVSDLNFPIKVVALPTVREKSGLAKSSRNEYLSAEDRQAATSIYAGLQQARNAYKKGLHQADELESLVRQSIELAGGKVQYIRVLDAKTLLAPASNILSRKGVILVATYFGSTRLIDNQELL